MVDQPKRHIVLSVAAHFVDIPVPDGNQAEDTIVKKAVSVYSRPCIPCGGINLLTAETIKQSNPAELLLCFQALTDQLDDMFTHAKAEIRGQLFPDAPKPLHAAPES